MAKRRKKNYRKTYTYDKKTGRKRRIDPKRSRIAKLAARKRRGKKMKASTKRKIALANKKARRSKRTKSGRRVIIIKRNRMQTMR